MVLSQSLWAPISFRLRLLHFQTYEYVQNLDIAVEHTPYFYLKVFFSCIDQKFGGVLDHSFCRKTNGSSFSIYSLLFGENCFGSGHDYLKLNFAPG